METLAVQYSHLRLCFTFCHPAINFFLYSNINPPNDQQHLLMGSSAKLAAAGKDLALLFFHSSSRSASAWMCSSCKKEVRQGTSGYTNLCTHIRHHHQDEVPARILKAQKRTFSAFKSITYPRKSIAAHGWLECIILCLLPFSFCENDVMRKHFKHDAMCRKTFMTYMQKLTRVVETVIRDRLPNRFAITFDGWAGGDTHYVSVFAVFPADNVNGYDRFLLACSPMENEDSLNANEHYEFLEWVLALFEKSMDNVVAVIGDNCSTNRAMSRRIGPTFVGCHSHRFNLAVKDMISEDEDLVQIVRCLMKKLSFQIPAAKLRRLTPLKSQHANATRWSSTFHMLKRYLVLKEFIVQLDDAEIIDLLPDGEEHARIETICNKMSDLDSITLQLQDDHTTISDARDMFDAIMHRHGCTKHRLAQNAPIVENVTFESALIKVQRGEENKLSTQEKKAISHLRVIQMATRTSTEDIGRMSFAQTVLKKRKMEKEKKNSDYMDLRFILPTSNLCERFFSIAGYALGDRRKRILPSNLECQLFLNQNANLWGLADVHSIFQ